MYVCMGVGFTCTWRPEVKIGCLLPLLSILVFETPSLVLTNLTRLVGQQAQGIYLSPALQPWDHRCIPPYLTVVWAPEIDAHRKLFADSAIFPSFSAVPYSVLGESFWHWWTVWTDGQHSGWLSAWRTLCNQHPSSLSMDLDSWRPSQVFM